MTSSRFRFLAISTLLLGSLFLTARAQIADYPAMNTPQAQKRKTVARKVYPDMSQEDLKKIMKEMSAEIGAKCDLCHNTRDFASMEKPMKEFTQYKIKMVEWLNAKYRPPNATWKYTCYSCHRGTVKPLPEVPPGTPPGTPTAGAPVKIPTGPDGKIVAPTTPKPN